MQKPPERVRSGPSTFFERRSRLFALRQDGTARTAGTDAVAEIAGDAKERYAVYEGAPPAAVDSADVLPVYSAGEEGPIAVPTGRVFVRLREGVRPDERRTEFTAAGFTIEKTLPYAPDAAWLRPTKGGVGVALKGIAALEAVPDVAHVEPQMLLERAFKRS